MGSDVGEGWGRYGYWMVVHDIGNRHQHNPDLSYKALNDPRLDDRQKKDIFHHLIHKYTNWFSNVESEVIKFELSSQGMESSDSEPHPLLSITTTQAEYQQWLETSSSSHKRKAHDSKMIQQPTRTQTSSRSLSLWQQPSPSSPVEDSIQYGPQ